MLDRCRPPLKQRIWSWFYSETGDHVCLQPTSQDAGSCMRRKAMLLAQDENTDGYIIIHKAESAPSSSGKLSAYCLKSPYSTSAVSLLSECHILLLIEAMASPNAQATPTLIHGFAWPTKLLKNQSAVPVYIFHLNAKTSWERGVEIDANYSRNQPDQHRSIPLCNTSERSALSNTDSPSPPL